MREDAQVMGAPKTDYTLTKWISIYDRMPTRGRKEDYGKFIVCLRYNSNCTDDYWIFLAICDEDLDGMYADYVTGKVAHFDMWCELPPMPYVSDHEGLAA